MISRFGYTPCVRLVYKSSALILFIVVNSRNFQKPNQGFWYVVVDLSDKREYLRKFTRELTLSFFAGCLFPELHLPMNRLLQIREYSFRYRNPV